MPLGAEQVGQVGGVDVGAGRVGLVKQERCRHLDVADAAFGELARLHAQIRDLVHREPEAELGSAAT